MKEIYMPNLLRIENINVLGENFSGLEYFLDFNMEDNSNFRALISMQVANLLENLILFDKVYVDLIELPVFLKELVNIDIESVKEILNKEILSYIDLKDLRVGVYYKKEVIQEKYTKSEQSFFLAAYGFSNVIPNTEKEFENYIFSFFKNDIEKFNNIKPYLTHIYNSRKITNNIIDEKELVNLIDFRLKKGDFAFLGIGGNNYYFITEKNKKIYNVICRLCRDNYITSKFGIYTYYKDDIIEALSSSMNEMKVAYNFEFFKVSNINKIPDFRQMFIEGMISLKDIIKIINNKNIFKFREWFFNNIDDEKNIEQEFVELLKKSPTDNIPIKIARFLIPNLIGLLPIYGSAIGLGLSTIDSFFLDKMIENGSLKFINNFNKITSKAKSKESIEAKECIQIPIKSEILIDNTLSGNDAIINEICNSLSDLEKNIDFSNEENILRIFIAGREISGKYWKYKLVLEKFMHLCMKLTEELSSYTFAIVKMLEDLYNIVKVIESFTFAKEYYFEGYYNLFSTLEKRKLYVDKNPYKIFNDEILRVEYEAFLKEKKSF